MIAIWWPLVNKMPFLLPLLPLPLLQISCVTFGYDISSLGAACLSENLHAAHNIQKPIFITALKQVLPCMSAYTSSYNILRYLKLLRPKFYRIQTLLSNQNEFYWGFFGLKPAENRSSDLDEKEISIFSKHFCYFISSRFQSTTFQKKSSTRPRVYIYSKFSHEVAWKRIVPFYKYRFKIYCSLYLTWG